MKTAKLSLMFLACTAAISAFAQNTTDSRCGTTNYDSSRNSFTIVNPNSGTPNQQCFVTVVPKQSWAGGMPNLTSSDLVEGNYEVTLSGGGGGGGGGVDRVGGGGGGAGAVPFITTRYLSPGVYRLTIGAGGQRGSANGGDGGDGAPTSLSNASSGETVAGFPRAEYWGGSTPQNYAASGGTRAPSRLSGFVDSQAASQPDSSGGQGVGGQSNGGKGGRIDGDFRGQDGGRLTNVAYAGEPGKGGTDLAGRRLRHEVAGGGGGGAGYGNGGNGDSSAEDGKMKTGAMSGDMGAGGGGGAGGEGVSDLGAQGGNGFIKLALKDPVPQAASVRAAPAMSSSSESVTQAAPVRAAPAASSSSETVTTPARGDTRPARRDRN